MGQGSLLRGVRSTNKRRSGTKWVSRRRRSNQLRNLAPETLCKERGKGRWERQMLFLQGTEAGNPGGSHPGWGDRSGESKWAVSSVARREGRDGRRSGSQAGRVSVTLGVDHARDWVSQNYWFLASPDG